VYRFPNNLEYEGLGNMRNHYEGFFKNNPDLNCKLINRIVNKNQVIDPELITANGNVFKAIAIYTIENGKITAVTFM
jgi:hypothetical protein